MSQHGKVKSTGHRNCAVVGCVNSWRQLEAWMNKECEEHQCLKGSGQCLCAPPFTLLPFPTKRHAERRKTWIRNIKRQSDEKGVWNPKSHHRVCSVHFPGGFPSDDHPDPILNMGYKSTTLPAPRRILKRRAPSVATVVDVEVVAETDNTAVEVPDCETANIVHSLDHSYTSFTVDNRTDDCCCDNDVCECCSGCLEKISQIRRLKVKIKCLEQQVKNQKEKATTVKEKAKTSVFENLLTTDAKAKFYTGLPTVALFVLIYQFLYPKVSKMRYWRGKVNTTKQIIRKYTSSPKKFGPRRKLSAKEELLLTLMKIRLGLLGQDLADRFNISESLVSSIFTTWIRILSRELKKMLQFPPKENVLSNLPKDAAEFPNLRRIIDCTEIFLERPRELLIQALTWSDYKKHNTGKILVSVTPRGKICYISKAWGGRASDVHIVNNSGFLNHIDQFDQVMADKGFTIENQLLLRGAKLIIPPGVKGQQQMLPEEVQKTKRVANFRIHVERAIGRMKDFRILNGNYPISMLPLIDDILVTCAALCNFLPPLVNSENLNE